MKFHEIFILFSDIRLQLNEQLRCLDIRVESQISLIQELQEFYRLVLHVNFSHINYAHKKNLIYKIDDVVRWSWTTVKVSKSWRRTFS